MKITKWNVISGIGTLVLIVALISMIGSWSSRHDEPNQEIAKAKANLNKDTLNLIDSCAKVDQPPYDNKNQNQECIASLQDIKSMCANGSDYVPACDDPRIDYWLQKRMAKSFGETGQPYATNATQSTTPVESQPSSGDYRDRLISIDASMYGISNDEIQLTSDWRSHKINTTQANAVTAGYIEVYTHAIDALGKLNPPAEWKQYQEYYTDSLKEYISYLELSRNYRLASDGNSSEDALMSMEEAMTKHMNASSDYLMKANEVLPK